MTRIGAKMLSLLLCGLLAIGSVFGASPEIDSSEHGVTKGKRVPSCKCGWANRATRRIVGGRDYGQNEYPFLASIARPEYTNLPLCGATIITSRHVITAAHCTVQFRKLVVIMGQHDRSGWGSTDFHGQMTMKPLKVDVRVIDLGVCSEVWKGRVFANPATQLCTHSKTKSACKGDSGGPVVYLDPNTNRYTLVGVVSFGYNCKDDAPSVQASVMAHLPWIQNIIQKTTPREKACS